jgi:radical SAM protein with 4Fe4S-binding SPASM domain
MFNAIEIEINHGCNKACSYCPVSTLERIEKGHMSLEIYEELISQLKDLNYEGRISYDFYNEPTLSPHLENYVAMAKAALPKSNVELYSNGTLLSVDRFQRLNAAGVDKFIVTKHEGIETYIFEETMTKLSAHELNKVQYREFTSLRLTNRGGVLPHIPFEAEAVNLPCMIPSMMLTVTVNGNVIPCFEDFYQKNQMGNIMDMKLKDIWLSESYISFRKKLFFGKRAEFEACKSCSRLEVLP